MQRAETKTGAQNRLLMPLSALITASWLGLLALDSLAGGPGHTAHLQSTQAVGVPDNLALVALQWILMLAAMMLPVALPMLTRLDTAIERAGGTARPTYTALLAYLSVWAAFGVAAYGLVPVLTYTFGTTGIIGPAALVLAGVYQSSPIKRFFIERACTPPQIKSVIDMGFARMVVLGAREGVVCVGCCWALMLLMVAGVANGTSGMLVLGILMWAERHSWWGRTLITPVGLFLVGLGMTLAWGGITGTLTWHSHSM